MLSGIWMISGALAVLSLLAVVVLIVRRLVASRAAKSSEDSRVRLRAQLVRFTADHDDDALAEIVRSTPHAINWDVGFEFLALLRGEDSSSIAAVFAKNGLGDYLRQRLAHGGEAERLRAAEALIAFPRAATVSALLQALDDKSPEVRIAVAIALARLDAMPSLTEVLQKIGSRGQRSRRLIDFFRLISSGRIHDVSRSAQLECISPLIRASAIDALGNSGNYEFLDQLEHLAVDPHTEVAAAAVRALGQLGHPGSVKTIVESMNHSDWPVRLQAADAAGSVGIASAEPQLIDMLADGEWMVRYAAAKSLTLLGESGMDSLRRIAGGGSSRPQRTASLVLAEGLKP